MFFSYQARDASGAMRKGTIEGQSVADVTRMLSGRGLEALDVKPVDAGDLPPPPVLAQVQWPRLIGALLVFGLVLVGLSRLPGMFRSAQVVEVVISGTVEAPGNTTFSRDDTKVYVSFPSINRTVRADAQVFEVEGGHLTHGHIAKWLPVPDPRAKYDITWFEDKSGGRYECHLSLSVPETPKVCRVTLRKRGFIRARTDDIPLVDEAGKLTGAAPNLTLVVGDTASSLHRKIRKGAEELQP